MTINAIEELEKRGYVFTLTKNGLKYEYFGTEKIGDFQQFFDRIKQHKEQAVDFLKSRQPDELVSLVDLHDWLEAHGARITGQSWLDSKGQITVHVEER